MILEEFSFGNFRSFRDINTLNMTAAKIKSKDAQLDVDNLIDGIYGQSYLKSKAVFGANASGKSNVLKALSTFLSIINNSVKDDSALMDIDSFELDLDTFLENSFFQIIFVLDQVRYRYGFEVDNIEVHSEWLYARSQSREVNYFIREGLNLSRISPTNFPEGVVFTTLTSKDGGKDSMFSNGSLFLTTIAGKEGGKDSIFRKDSLFLTTLSTFGFGVLSAKIVNALGGINIMEQSRGATRFMPVMAALNDEKKKRFILKFLQLSDVAIEDILVHEFNSPDIEGHRKGVVRRALIVKKPIFKNSEKTDSDASMHVNSQESEGTQKIIELSTYLYDVFAFGGVLVIDEFDAKLHPLLTSHIVALFNSSHNTKAQLIFTTHDTNLLSNDVLRRDQIDLVEKDKYGASHLSTLVEFKGVRNEASFQKNYLLGKYGAVPFVNHLDELFADIRNA